MDGIFDSLVTYTFITQGFNIAEFDLIRLQGQFLDQVQYRPQLIIDRGALPVI